MNPKKIKTGEPFESLFPVDAHTLDAIAKDMELHGYDDAHPIVLWDEKGIVIDGHTRLQAAIAAGIDDVLVIRNSFDDEDAAVEYAIHCQRDRRNLSDADMLRWIAEVDKRKTAKDRAAMGGVAKNTECLAPSGAKQGDRKSASATAAVVGTSARTVERARTVLDKATDEVKQAVEKGEMSINQAYNETVNPREPRDPLDAPTEVERPFQPESAALLQLKRDWRRANKKDKKAFREWINEN
jgi:ParB-like chromosome segregation protein Spo0J